MCRCASRKISGLLVSTRANPHRSIGSSSDPQCTKIHAAHRAENATPDRDKNSPPHSRENGSDCRRLHWLRLRKSRLTALSAGRILVPSPQRLLKQHQLAALWAPKHENAFDFHRLIPRQLDNVVLCSTSILTLPSSVNATTASSGCSVRCFQRIR